MTQFRRHNRRQSILTRDRDRDRANGAEDTYCGDINANIPATELRWELASVLSRVRRQGESFLIEQDGEAVASLEPMGASPGTTWRTLTHALHDRSIGDIDFAADLEDVQRNQPEMPTTVWPS